MDTETALRQTDELLKQAHALELLLIKILPKTIKLAGDVSYLAGKAEAAEKAIKPLISPLESKTNGGGK